MVYFNEFLLEKAKDIRDTLTVAEDSEVFFLRTNIGRIFELAKHISIELDYIGAKFGISNANISESNEQIQQKTQPS